MKITKKLHAIALGALLFTFAGCQAGIEYETVPEDVYSNVSLKDALCSVKSRGIFDIYGVNWKEWKTEVLETTITTYIDSNSKYTNTTSAPVTILGATVAPGGTINLRNSIAEESDASAPDGKLYVLNVFVNKKVVYKTKNNGWVFDASKIASNAKLVKDANGTTLDAGKTQSEYVQYPVDNKTLVVGILLSNESQCSIYPQAGSPELGKPSDFSQPHKYLVVNTARRPSGAPEAERMYEVRIHILP